MGDEDLLGDHGLTQLQSVERVLPVPKPFKLASREFSVQSTAIRLGDAAHTVIGGRDLVVIASPCSVRGRDMMFETAHAVQRSRARLLRAGAFKPRSSPYAFQGMGEKGLETLAEVRAETGMPMVTERMDARQVELVASYADVLQIGARSMQNFSLLTEVGRTLRPTLLKRGLSATITELLMAAEYITAHGYGDVTLCERGIRAYGTATRNTLDMPAVAAVADGLIVEVHPHPATAKSDGEQSLKPFPFAAMMQQVRAVALAVGRDFPAVSIGGGDPRIGAA